jgi:hypothetical protein
LNLRCRRFGVNQDGIAVLELLVAWPLGGGWESDKNPTTIVHNDHAAFLANQNGITLRESSGVPPSLLFLFSPGQEGF